MTDEVLAKADYAIGTLCLQTHAVVKKHSDVTSSH